MFFDCHRVAGDGITLIAWPDGGAYFDQEQLTVEVFGVIRDELIHILKREADGKRN